MQHKFLSALWGYGGPNCDAEMTGLTTSANDLTPTFKVTSTGAAIAANTVKSSTRPAGCMWFNPTSNAIEQGNQPNPANTTARVGVNPDYHAATANDPVLLRYLTDRRTTDNESSLITADFILQGLMGSLGGGDAAWAFGLSLIHI